MNRLAQESSPYLRQHADNPVHWQPWGPEAMAEAVERDVPVLLSVGYSACHWCHVMERESFEDARIAALMNEHFVCVKVDREERPDLDAVYMQATLTLSGGHGGWPMTVFLTPDLEPFFAGTYFPPTDRHGMAGFPTVVATLAQRWRDHREQVVKQARTLTDLLREAAATSQPVLIDPALRDVAARELLSELDPDHGGFGDAPKFPRAEAHELLLRRWRRTGDAEARRAVELTLTRMAEGGIYDQVGGGFHRYSTDDEWLVPHFEKMLYDQALLSRLYAWAYQATSRPLFHRVATETLDYVLREMTGPEGGFYSATDADTDGVEGASFVWTPGEVEAAVLDPTEARAFCAYYDVREGGNWEGKSILHVPRPVDAVAAELGLTPDALMAAIDSAVPKVYRARWRRTRPALDDKRLTAWNGLMLSAFAWGARVLGEQRYLDAANKNASFLLETMVRPDGGLFRSFRSGRAHLDATLEDYAFLADALIDLYEAGGERKHLAAALVLAERLVRDFAPADGGAFYATPHEHEPLIVRYREGHDGAIPNANAVAAQALARLSFHMDLPELRSAAELALRAWGEKVARLPRGFCQTLAAVDLLTEGPLELALVGTSAEPNYLALLDEVNRPYLPNQLLAHGSGEPPAADDLPPLPLLAGKERVDGRAALYVCRQYTCREPVTDPARVAAALDAGSGARGGAARLSRGSSPPRAPARGPRRSRPPRSGARRRAGA